MLTTVEKVLLLQDVDIFEHTSTEDLSHVAAICEEIEYKADDVIFKEEVNYLYVTKHLHSIFQKLPSYVAYHLNHDWQF